mmetsp:Transcript_7713/g.22905  ORF Transcript_7713/g.22905 Transcript_7713/m.22905 type:complete len:180 (-) Transcript_7713:36-575(-)
MRLAFALSCAVVTALVAPPKHRARHRALHAGGGFGAPAPARSSEPKKYNKASLQRAQDRFEELVEKPRGTHVVDVYAGAPKGQKLFFIGKVCHDLKTPPECALKALEYLLAPHARSLQPLLEREKSLDYAIATGNTEVQVAKGEVALTLVEPAKAKDSHQPGFRPELYENGEDGFYVRR